MRPTDSSYDRNQGSKVTEFLDALRRGGYRVEDYVTGGVEIDGVSYDAVEFQRLVESWDDSPEGMDELGFGLAGDALRDDDDAEVL